MAVSDVPGYRHVADLQSQPASFPLAGPGYAEGMAEKEFREGDHVSWASHSGRAYGVVKEKLTYRTHVRGHTVAASEEEPQYRIRNDHSGRDVAHRPEALRHEAG